MSTIVNQETQGNGYARILIGVTGVALVAGGMLITWFIVTTWPVAFLAATPGLALTGYGVVLLMACAFYDIVDVAPGPLGIPTIRVRRGALPAAAGEPGHQSGAPPPGGDGRSGRADPD
jgi:hypothetical protein